MHQYNVSHFLRFYHEHFRASDLYASMAQTIEDSPYHRERNVAIHTDMVVSEFLLNSRVTGLHTTIGALACAFHDVGKPAAQEHKFSEERGNYRSYRGHELLSAREWEDFAATNWSRYFKPLGLTAVDIWRVGWIIEHHLPWNMSDPKKLKQLYVTTDRMLGSGWLTFTDVVVADQYGRIPDDMEKVRNSATEWAHEFNKAARSNTDVYTTAGTMYGNINEEKPIVHIPIAVSGAGKTTLRNEYHCDMVWCMDDFRTEWYCEDYNEAFRLSCEDKDFKNKVHSEYIRMLNEQPRTLYVDGTNLSKKARKFLVNEARARGFQVVAHLLPISRKDALARQRTRGDKQIPDTAVLQQYRQLHYPSYYEFDHIVVHENNLR